MPRSGPRDRVCAAGSRHSPPVAANRPDRIRLADIARVPTGGGRLYPAAILDLFAREIVGWTTRGHRRAALAIAAPTMAVRRRCPGPGLAPHSDLRSFGPRRPACRSRYAAGSCREILQEAALTQSRSGKASRRDTAPREGVFGTLKTAPAPQREHPDRAAARRDLFASIAGYDPRRRARSVIAQITPKQAPRKTP